MIDKISLSATTAGQMSPYSLQKNDMLATGLSQPSGVSALRARLLAHADTGLAPQNITPTFPSRMTDALRSVAQAQNDSAQITRDYELGRENDLSKVMVSQQVSSLGFQMTLNVRNKVLSAYKDIMNMPV